jgi:hypothetical protein
MKEVTLEILLKEIETALKYGVTLGYAECTNKTLGHRPDSSNPDHAIKFYLKQTEEKYSTE